MKFVRSSGLSIGLLALIALVACSGEGAGGGEPPATAEETVKWIADGLAANDPTVVWDALPASYQAELSAILHEFGGKVDPGVWNQSVGVLQQFSAVLRDKKEYWLNSSALPDDFKADDVVAGWDSMVGFMDTLFGSELADVETLKSLDVRDFMAGTGSRLMEQGYALTALSSEAQEDVGWNKISQLTATKVSEENGAVTVKIELPDETPTDLAFIRVEERWIPKDMADEWPGDMAGLRENLAKMDPAASGQSTTQIKMFLSMLEGFLGQLESAGSQEEFDQRLTEGAAPLLLGAMMMGQGTE